MPTCTSQNHAALKIPSVPFISLSWFLKKIVFKFIDSRERKEEGESEREEGRGGERREGERNIASLCIHWLILLSDQPGDGTCNLGLPGRCSNQLPYPARASILTAYSSWSSGLFHSLLTVTTVVTYASPSQFLLIISNQSCPRPYSWGSTDSFDALFLALLEGSGGEGCGAVFVKSTAVYGTS